MFRGAGSRCFGFRVCFCLNLFVFFFGEVWVSFMLFRRSIVDESVCFLVLGVIADEGVR